MKDGLRIAIAVGAGYLMGRRRKMKLALTLAAAGASGRIGKNPAGLVKQGTKLLSASPEVKALTDTVRGRLVEAGKAAAVTAASSQIDALSDRLQRRTDALLKPQVPGGTRGEEEEDYEDERRDEEPEERPRRRPAADRRPRAPREDSEDEDADRPRAVRRSRGAEPDEEPDEETDRPRRGSRLGVPGRSPVRRTRR
ncbi:hypothetical protein NE236_02470 [Actinoallomurus purpureus]|uniref:hypothetical protein n=1 Tax=Actinoallomurus purpureus TaxID=478114 RepID=UPI002092224F|nr:hypothetical protein [Actinoallomurus purpureus]MCO6003834.1 hypothetical protein [Actinoallomurus purpureus]